MKSYLRLFLISVSFTFIFVLNVAQADVRDSEKLALKYLDGFSKQEREKGLMIILKLRVSGHKLSNEIKNVLKSKYGDYSYFRYYRLIDEIQEKEGLNSSNSNVSKPNRTLSKLPISTREDKLILEVLAREYLISRETEEIRLNEMAEALSGVQPDRIRQVLFPITHDINNSIHYQDVVKGLIRLLDIIESGYKLSDETNKVLQNLSLEDKDKDSKKTQEVSACREGFNF